MDSSIFFGGSVIAAVVAGMIALFAPCCISVMLPAYFASSFQNRRLLVAMTFLFAAGIATVILPIALGASVLRQLLTEQHSVLYVTGGILMLGLAVYVLFGGKIHLPMPGRRAAGMAGPLSVYTLGIFSGMASSCCAPVLAGVIALSSVASSFALALGLGTAYVFGMVAPLFALALLWERYDWHASRLFRPRTFTWRVGALQRTLGATDLATGVLLALIGAGMIWVGLAFSSMPPLSGWQAEFDVKLQHLGHLITRALGWIPGWLAAGIVLTLLLLLGRRAFTQVVAQEGKGDLQDERDLENQSDGQGGAHTVANPEVQKDKQTKEAMVEYQDA